jgi:circadian clock protein KaiC
MEPPASIATRVPQLDLILGGGIVPSSLVLIVGPPGSGKTVLASQIGFAMAERGERVVFITTFSNPHNKLINSLQRFQFFNPDYVGERIKLINLQHQLMISLDEAESTIVREAREHKAKYVILDSFQGVRVVTQDASASHQFLYELSTKLNMLGVTTLVTYEPASALETHRPEFMAVDAVLMVSQDWEESQVTRRLRVIKHRGMNPLSGYHSFAIKDTGLVCFPRQESLPAAPDVAVPSTRVSFGVPVLDQVLHGGLIQGTSTLIAGPAGAGKTVLSMHFAFHGLQNDEIVLWIGSGETFQQLLAKGRGLGMDFQAAYDSGHFLMHSTVHASINPDEIAQEVRHAVGSQNVRRVIIDGFDALDQSLVQSERSSSFWRSLFAFLRSHEVTTCVTTHYDPEYYRQCSNDHTNVCTLPDNVLVLQLNNTSGVMTRSLAVQKMRFSNHEDALCRYTIGSNGFALD